MKLIFATGNKGKLREAREILEPHGFEVVSPFDLGLTKEQVDVEETGKTFEENAIIKVQNLWQLTGLPCFADDSGLVVDALGGAPGIYSARYASLDGSGEDHNFASNIDKLLHNLEGVENRRARFVCVAALILPEAGIKTFRGTCEGRIAFDPAGCGGFGYDPVFIADAYPDRTLAEVDESAKNAISHRGNALAKMLEYLTIAHPNA
ncbi:MAG: RdgB/HAM1 family non-canonical purine NTP pyrophosphatase [Bacteroidales bacterium]|nr:RdgB/HAM1 family non-canonical purine NTP pyrophosphatase [Bacteroidales bacterium]